MRRIKIIGLVLVVMAVLSVVAAASAVAAKPEFVPSNGKFPVTFKFTSGVSTLEAVGKHTFTCTNSSGAGKIATEKLFDGLVITYTGCTSNVLSAKCNSEGQAAGTIVTDKLSAHLVYDNTGKTAVALLVANEEGSTHPFAKFECGGLEKIEYTGSILLLITGPLNTSAELFKLSAKQKEGIPEDTSYWNDAGTELLKDEQLTTGSGLINFGPVQSGLEGTGDLLTQGKVTIDE